MGFCLAAVASEVHKSAKSVTFKQHWSKSPSHSNSQKKDYTIALFTQSLVTWPVEMLNTWVIQQTLQPHKNNDTTK